MIAANTLPFARGVCDEFEASLHEDKWFITNADLLLAFIQLLPVFIGSLMLLEQLANNTLLIYDNFVFLDLSISGFEFIAILSIAPVS